MGSEVTADGTAPRILVVDDEPHLAERVRSHLVAQGYSVELAVSGKEALLALQAAPFDLVISDVMMPIMDGFDLLKAMRGNPALVTIPFILIIAPPSDPSFTWTGEEEIGLLIKPVRKPELMTVVEVMLARFRPSM